MSIDYDREPRQFSARKGKFSLLLVDDEERIRNFLNIKLKLMGYGVTLARNGVEALEQMREQEPDLVILDVIMPKKDGFETLKELRSFSSVPVIMLTAQGDDFDKIKGLGLRADDYMTKPFNPDELVARIEAIRGRLGSPKRKEIPEELILNGLSINFNRRCLNVRGEEVKLTKIEWLLLNELAANAGRLMTHHDLLGRIWGPEYCEDVRILRTWICRLRHKIEINPAHFKIISTVPKAGYIFNKQ
jgi:two-component system KDP operon response regulator KdpE